MPIFVRAGKSLAATVTEAIVRFKGSGAVFDDGAAPAPNHLRFRIGPEMVVALGANVKKLGEEATGEAVELELHRASKSEMKGYERLLGDAIDGDPTLFATKAAVEESWRIIDPVANAKGEGAPSTYDAGSWGPAEASRVAPEGGWQPPR